MRILFRANARLAQGMAILAAVLIAVMIAAITAEVLLRTLRLGAIPGVLEATEYALYFSTFLAAPRLYAHAEHIRVDVLIDRLPMNATRRLDIGVSILVIIVSGVFFVYGVRVFWQSFSAGTKIFKDVVLMQWWIDWALPLAFLSIALLALERLISRAGMGATPATQR